MNPIELLDGYTKRLRAADKEIRRLEKLATKLSEQYRQVREKRAGIEDDVRSREGAIASLETKRKELFGQWSEAQFEGDVPEQRRIASRRSQIDAELSQCREYVRKLRDSLDELESDEQAIATAYAELEAINIGDAWTLFTEVRNHAVNHQSKLRTRMQQVSKTLPPVDPTLLAEARAELNPEQVEKERREAEKLEQYYAKRREQRAKKDAAAKRQFVGVSSFGGPRRMEPDERDFSS